jgi:hypothetical protein
MSITRIGTGPRMSQAVIHSRPDYLTTFGFTLSRILLPPRGSASIQSYHRPVRYD